MSKLKGLDISLNDFVNGYWYEDELNEVDKKRTHTVQKILELTFGEIKLVHSEISLIDIETKVWYFEKYKKYFQLSTYSSSWGDTDWNTSSFVEVTPEEKTIIIYKDINEQI